MKKIVISTIIIMAVIGACYSIWPYFGYNGNSLEVTAQSPLNIKKLKIYKGLFYNQYGSEEFRNKGQLIFSKKNLMSVENDYGENDFLFIYADKFYYQFRHFKTNNKQRDNYYFKIMQVGDSIILSAIIKGTDPINFKAPFHLIN